MSVRTFKFLLTICGIVLLHHAKAATYTDATNLLTYLTSGYNKYVRPRSNQGQPTEIGVTFQLKSISSPDEVNGVLTSVASIIFHWYDDILIWNPSSYGNMNSIKIEESLIWIPKFIISNPAKKVTKLGMPTIDATVFDTGLVDYELGEMLETTCDVDVTYFPFDTQNCVLEIMPFGYLNTEVNLTASPVDLLIYSENNAWIVKSTSSEVASLGSQLYVKVTLSIERRYAFFTLNLYTPVLILAFLNTMVFILPSDSGERVGYSITCLLSLSVYMTFASETLPQSSKPIAVIIYVLLFYILISTVICAGTIIGLKLHLQDNATHPPEIVLKLFCFTKANCRRAKVKQTTDSEKCDEVKGEEVKTTWKDIANRFDKICFAASIFCIVLLTIVYLIVVRRQ